MLIDCISDPVLVINAQGTIVGVNQAVAKYTNYTLEQQIGKNFNELDIFSDETKLLLQKNSQDRLSGKNIPPYEIKVVVQNEVVCLEVKGNRIVDDGQTLDLIILHDVTERSNNHEVLKRDLLESEEKLRGIVSSIKEAIILVDDQAKITYWNPAAEKTFGYTRVEAIGKSIHDLIVPKTMCKEAKERIEASVKIFTETGAGYFTVGKVQLVGCRKDGSELPIELSLSPMKLDGKWNAVGVAKDITAIKQSERKLRDAEQRYHALFNQAPIGV